MTRRVAFLLGRLVVGGAETQALELARHLRHLGWEAVFLAMESGGALEEPIRREGFRIHVMGREFWRSKSSPGFWLNLVRTIHRIQRTCRDEHCRVLMSFLFWENVVAVPAARLSPYIRAVVTCRLQIGTHKDQRRHYQPIEDATNLFTHAVIANARAVARDTAARERFLRGRLRVIYNGVDNARFGGAEPIDLAPLFSDSTDVNPFTLACVANLRAIKRHDILVRAVAEARRLGAPVRAVLVGEDRGAGPALRELAESLGIASHVAFAGGVADPAPYYRAADAAALTSDFEGLPNGVLEGLAAERPVVATRVGGIPELIRDGRSGFLFEAGDWRVAGERLARLANDRALCARMGAYAGRLARARFSNERLAAAHAALFESVLANGRPPRGLVLTGEE